MVLKPFKLLNCTHVRAQFIQILLVIYEMQCVSKCDLQHLFAVYQSVLWIEREDRSYVKKRNRKVDRIYDKQHVSFFTGQYYNDERAFIGYEMFQRQL